MDILDLESDLLQASAEGCFPQCEGDIAESDESRQMVGRWLLWLGYLKSPGQLNANHRREVDEALEAFRSDCGIADDRDSEDAAARLRELVAFESDTPIDWWLAPRRRRALMRGVGLRLYAFHLLARAPRPQFDQAAVEKGLADFIEIAHAIQLDTSDVEDGVNATTMRALFRQDDLARRLGRVLASRSFRYRKNASRTEKKHMSRRIWTFVTGVSSVELWLSGYAVSIGSDKISALFFNENRYSLKRGLQQFWRDQKLGRSRTPNLESMEAMLTALFPRIEELDTQAAAIETEDMDLVAATMRSPDAVHQVKKALKSVVSWAWDGLKRAWNWVVNLFRGAVRAVGEIFVNIARLLKERIKSCAPLVWAALHGFGLSAKFLFSSMLPGSDLDSVAGLKRAGGDFEVWCAPTAPISAVSAFSSRIQLVSMIFELSTRLLAVLLRLFSAIVRGAAFVVGWIASLFAVFRLRDELSKLPELGRAAYDLILKYDQARREVALHA